jgi:hypothetical protein
MSVLKGPLFKKTVEDFKCINCGFIVKGNGYTDHCPNCLWSLHVDINPGDRQCKCLGKLKPISAVYYRNGNFKISYICLKCGTKKQVYSAADDNQDELEKLMK